MKPGSASWAAGTIRSQKPFCAFSASLTRSCVTLKPCGAAALAAAMWYASTEFTSVPSTSKIAVSIATGAELVTETGSPSPTASDSRRPTAATSSIWSSGIARHFGQEHCGGDFLVDAHRVAPRHTQAVGSLAGKRMPGVWRSACQAAASAGVAGLRFRVPGQGSMPSRSRQIVCTQSSWVNAAAACFPDSTTARSERFRLGFSSGMGAILPSEQNWLQQGVRSEHRVCSVTR